MGATVAGRKKVPLALVSDQLGRFSELGCCLKQAAWPARPTQGRRLGPLMGEGVSAWGRQGASS